MGLARESSLSPHREGSAEQPTNTWLGSHCSDCKRGEGSQDSPQPMGIWAQRQREVLFGSWSLQQAQGCRAKEGTTLQRQTWFPQIPPASAALLPACCSRGQGGQSLQKAQQLPKCLPRSSSASHAAGGLIPRLESNQSLTQGREGPFI